MEKKSKKIYLGLDVTVQRLAGHEKTDGVD